MKNHKARLVFVPSRSTPGADPPEGWNRFWRMAIVADARQPSTATKIGGSGILLLGWGFDADAPLRPWPQFGVDAREDAEYGVIGWVVWFGFLLSMQLWLTPLPRTP